MTTFKQKSVPTVEAIQLLSPLVVGGNNIGNIGDWVLTSQNGSMIIINEKFKEQYEVVSPLR